MSSFIRYLDRTLSFQRLLWGVPLCLAAHNLEEARRVGEFVGLTRRINPWITLEGRQYLVLTALMTLAAVALASRAAAGDERGSTLLLWIQAGLFVNAFAPHLPSPSGRAATRRVSPPPCCSTSPSRSTCFTPPAIGATGNCPDSPPGKSSATPSRALGHNF